MKKLLPLVYLFALLVVATTVMAAPTYMNTSLVNRYVSFDYTGQQPGNASAYNQLTGAALTYSCIPGSCEDIQISASSLGYVRTGGISGQCSELQDPDYTQFFIAGNAGITTPSRVNSTLNIWIKKSNWDDAAQASVYLEKGTTYRNWFFIDTDNYFKTASYTSLPGTVTTKTYVGGFTDNTWHMFTVTFESATYIKVYVDGQLVGQNQTTAFRQSDSTTSFYFGADGTGSGTPHSFGAGNYFDEMMWANGTWSANAINELYTYNSAGYSWPFNQSMGDSTAPTLSGSVPTDGMLYTNPTQTIPLGISATDNVNVSAVWAIVTYPNGSTTTKTFTQHNTTYWNTTFTLVDLQGRYNVSYRANDTTNNNASASGYFIVDSLAPSITITSPANNTMYYTTPASIVINATITDASTVSGANCTINDGTIDTPITINLTSLGSSLYTLTYSSDAIYNLNLNFSCSAIDSNGLSSTSSLYKFAVNTTAPPTIVTNFPTSNPEYTTVGAVVPFSVNVTQLTNPIASVVAIVSRGGSSNTYTMTQNGGAYVYNYVTQPLSDGSYNITFRVTDSVGGYSSSYGNFTLLADWLPVINSNTSNSGALTWSGTATFALNASLTNGTVILNLNGTLLEANYSNGLYTVSRFVTYGNYSYNWTVYSSGYSHRALSTPTYLYVINFAPDTTKPSVVLISPTLAQQYTTDSDAILSVAVTDDRTIGFVWGTVTNANGNTTQVFLNHMSEGTYTGMFDLTSQKSGVYYVNFTAYDTTGNVNDTVSTFFVYTAPKTTIFNANSCPATLEGSVLYLGLLAFFVGIIVIALGSRIGMVGMLGSIALIMYSLFMTGCSPVFGLLTFGVGVAFFIYFLFGKY
jgi:hypothetical protein